MAQQETSESVNYLDNLVGEILSSRDDVKKHMDKRDVAREVVSDPSGIVDIITFCESPKYLNLLESNFELWVSQRVVLKCFYMGTIGNKDLTLTQEEWQWLYDKKQFSVIEKLKKKESGMKFRFSELILVLGRRSSKTVMTSIIACYEAYKLMVVNKGDVYGYFKMPHDKKIAIINVATSREQSGILFSEIEARINNSEFFKNRVASSSMSSIKLLTDMDIKKRNDAKNPIRISGSILMICGHSNPRSLRGHAAICVIFDELAFYDEGAKVSAKDFYNALTPSVMEFATSAIDGEPWGHIVAISSTGPTNGYFYKLSEMGQKKDNMLFFQTPTWDFNPKMPFDHPELAERRERDPESFGIEFGAEWPVGSMFGQYFPKELIDKIFRLGMENNIQPQENPEPGGEYYFHIDPGLTGSKYVLVGMQRKFYRDSKGILCPRAVLALVKTFTPITAAGLEWTRIDNDVLELCRKFRPILVTYDQWNSMASLDLLTRNGINVKQTSFNRSFKCKIYQNLRDLMSKPECGIYVFSHEDLYSELTHLKFRPTPRGVSIGADRRSECPTDDVADCLAGSSFSICGKYYSRLPEPVLAYTGSR